jgi:type I restriction enzyme, S subunit
MELKPGYKQTDVGVIPEDWSVKRLGDIGDALIGLTYSPANVHSDGLLVLRSSNIADGRLSFEDNVFVKMEVPDKIIVREGDILICVRNGSRALIGKCAKIDKRAEGMTFGAFMAVFRTDFHDFVFHQFQSDIVERQIHAYLGATINQITNASLNSFLIPLPPTKAEQEAIAGALSDADALIKSLDQLIAKKRQIKQGAMQELLCPKDGWVEGEIRSIVVLIIDYRGRTPKKLGMEWGGGDIRTLSAGNVKMGWIDLEADTYFGSEQLYQKWMTQGDTKKDDILITTEAPLGNVALIPDDKKYILGQRVILLRVDPQKLDSHFLYHFLSSYQFQNCLKKDSSGSTATGIQRLKFEKIKVFYSLSLAEQTAIASILTDMDTEIAVLEAKLAKARQLKQGMMQELLTGKTRLVESGKLKDLGRFW